MDWIVPYGSGECASARIMKASIGTRLATMKPNTEARKAQYNSAHGCDKTECIDVMRRII